VSANGVVFSVACQAPTNEECHGAGALSTAEQLSGGRVVALLPAEHGLATATVGVGESAFALNSGQTRNVVVPLDRTGRELFERFHPLAVTLTVTLSNGAGAAPTSVTERKLVIIALNTRLVGHSIERHIFAHRHLRSRVRCPAVVIQAKGNTFTCWATGTVRQGRHREHYKTPFTVEQQDSRGDIYYHS
jgi:hypothetical protein